MSKNTKTMNKNIKKINENIKLINANDINDTDYINYLNREKNIFKKKIIIY